MKTLLLALALSLPAHSQGILDTGSWKPTDSMYAGAVVAVFSNIYCDQTKAKWYWRILIPMIFSAGYELYRAIEGKKPLSGNVIYSGVGAASFTFVYRITF